MTRVFVSHAHADGAFVESVLLPVLRDEGLTPWYSKDDIAGGAEWERQIKASLDAADLLLVVLSPRAAGSKWVHAEVSWGLHRLADRLGFVARRHFLPTILDVVPTSCMNWGGHNLLRV